MECKFCGKPGNKKNFIFETKHYDLFLSDNQYYLARCVIRLKRHAASLSELDKAEWLDFHELVKKVESSFKKAFDATLFNWSCNMNHSFQSKPYIPHVHFHLVPRYDRPVKFGNILFEDKEFGFHHEPYKEFEVSESIKEKIIQKIKENL